MSRIVFISILLVLFVGKSTAQLDSLGWGTHYPAVDERKIIETKWKYTYAIHLESNTTIHKAEKFYDYFLYFRYNYTYQQYLNGRLSKGTWSLNGSDLFYSFKHIKKFEVAEITKNTLVLEFTQANSKGTYQYHFIRVESKDAPFVKPRNELPDVLVESLNPKKRGLFGFGKRRKKKRRKKKKRKKKEETYISIELIGGGFYGGIDPVLRDYIQIKSDGRLIKEHKSLHGGLTVTKKDCQLNYFLLVFRIEAIVWRLPSATFFCIRPKESKTLVKMNSLRSDIAWFGVYPLLRVSVFEAIVKGGGSSLTCRCS